MEVYKKEAADLVEQLLTLRSREDRRIFLKGLPDYWKLRSFIRIPTTLQQHCIFRHTMSFQKGIIRNAFSTAFRVRNTVKRMTI